MYAQEIVDIRKECAQEQLGFELEYHSISEIDTFNEHLEKSMRYGLSGEPIFSRALVPWEFRFIQNERYLSQCDGLYWLTHYAKISNESDQIVHFTLRDTQLIFFSVIAKLEAARSAIELIIAKGRQQGVTTMSELLIGHRIFFHNDTNALTASADRVKTEEMGKKILTAYDQMPWWLKPKSTRRVATIPGLLEFESINTRVSFQHGSTAAKEKGKQKVGLGRGGTRTSYHISECSAFPKAQEQIDASLLRATHAHPKVLGILESTFAGSNDWFAKKYDHAKLHRGDIYEPSRLTAIFFSWACMLDLYPTPTWAATHPIPYDWQPEGKVLEQIHKAELFIRTDPILSIASLKLDHSGTHRVLGRDWVMPKIQQWFYHCGFKEYEAANDLNTWYQEMACDDEESKISVHESAFKKGTLDRCYSERERQFDVYSIIGQSVESEMEPSIDEIDYSLPRVPIRHRDRSGNLYEWELVPLKYAYFEQFDGDYNEHFAIDGKLFIFKHPYFRDPDPNTQSRRQEYGVGADSSTGIGRDFSAISVTQKGSGAMPDVQCAEWRSKRVGHVEIFAFAMAIALYFRQDPNDFMSFPMFAIEQLASVGDVCQTTMKRMGYPNGRFYNWGRFDSKQLKTNTNKQGWYTTGYSRPYLIDTYISCIRNSWYILNSPWTIMDCRKMEVHMSASGRRKTEHSDEGYDDAVFAGAISSFILHDLDLLADRSKNQRRPVESILPPLSIAESSGGIIIPTSPMVPSKTNRLVQPSIDDIIRGGSGLEQFRY